jgi:UDP-GlcNAc:undecaprenyl-phosphate GlcNAc-1-phosphate transferase
MFWRVGVWAVIVLLAVLQASPQALQYCRTSLCYIAGICVVYLVQVMPGALAECTLYRNILFAAMTVAVAVGFRFSKERFRVTPMDFLVVLVALVVPNLPDVTLETGHVGMGVAMLIVLFYAIELVLNNIWRLWDVMRLTTYVTLAVLGLRG